MRTWTRQARGWGGVRGGVARQVRCSWVTSPGRCGGVLAEVLEGRLGSWLSAATAAPVPLGLRAWRCLPHPLPIPSSVCVAPGQRAAVLHAGCSRPPRANGRCQAVHQRSAVSSTVGPAATPLEGRAWVGGGWVGGWVGGYSGGSAGLLSPPPPHATHPAPLHLPRAGGARTLLKCG